MPLDGTVLEARGATTSISSSPSLLALATGSWLLVGVDADLTGGKPVAELDNTGEFAADPLGDLATDWAASFKLVTRLSVRREAVVEPLESVLAGTLLREVTLGGNFTGTTGATVGFSSSSSSSSSSSCR